MRLKVNNLPSDVSASDMRVEFNGLKNATVSGIQHESGVGVIRVEIPQHDSAGPVPVKLYCTAFNTLSFQGQAQI